MRNAFLTSASIAAAVSGLTVVAACVGDDPGGKEVPADGSSAADASSQPGSDAGAVDSGQPAGPFCLSVPPAGEKETVFCEDFEGNWETRWDTVSAGGALARTDVDGVKAIDFTLNAVTDADYDGPRLLWRHLAGGGSAEVSYDFMLVEAPTPLDAGSGQLWFGRIRSVGLPNIGFGASLEPGTVAYSTLSGAGTGEEAGGTFTFAPKEWTKVTLRYATTETGAAYSVSVGSNPAISGSFGLGSDVALIEGDAVILGAFVRDASPALKARVANVVIRTKTP